MTSMKRMMNVSMSALGYKWPSFRRKRANHHKHRVQGYKQKTKKQPTLRQIKKRWRPKLKLRKLRGRWSVEFVDDLDVDFSRDIQDEFVGLMSAEMDRKVIADLMDAAASPVGDLPADFAIEVEVIEIRRR